MNSVPRLGSKAPEVFLDTMNQYLDPMFRGETQAALTEAGQKIDSILEVGVAIPGD